MTGTASYLLDETDERGQRYTALHMGKSIAEKLWDDLDEAFAELRQARETNDEGMQRFAGGKCKGLAISLQHMLAHYYPHVDDVTRECLKRYKIAQGTAEFEPTPGYKFNPPPPGSKAHKTANKRMTGDAPKNAGIAGKNQARQLAGLPKEKSFSASEVEGIRNALESNLFTVEQLAETFKTTPAQIRSLTST